jgi:hypothetical protein
LDDEDLASVILAVIAGAEPAVDDCPIGSKRSIVKLKHFLRFFDARSATSRPLCVHTRFTGRGL